MCCAEDILWCHEVALTNTSDHPAGHAAGCSAGRQKGEGVQTCWRRRVKRVRCGQAEELRDMPMLLLEHIQHEAQRITSVSLSYPTGARRVQLLCSCTDLGGRWRRTTASHASAPSTDEASAAHRQETGGTHMLVVSTACERSAGRHGGRWRQRPPACVHTSTPLHFLAAAASTDLEEDGMKTAAALEHDLVSATRCRSEHGRSGRARRAWLAAALGWPDCELRDACSASAGTCRTAGVCCDCSWLCMERMLKWRKTRRCARQQGRGREE